MLTKWQATNPATTVPEAVRFLSGRNLKELKTPLRLSPRKIEKLPEAANLIFRCVEEKRHISIIGDYDADGVTASAILFLLLQSLGVTPDIRLPKRMTEGYGLSEKIVDEVLTKNKDGLLLTVDNGIVANKAIQKAKDAGLTVIVMDHHLPGKELPPADVLVDQWAAAGEEMPSNYYCGAGLALKLAQYMIPENPELLRKLTALAAIGTIGDVMSLTGDNRAIVKEGLLAISRGDTTSGLQSLLSAMGKSRYDSTTIAFYIVPAINASGRLLDDGARMPCAVLAADRPVPKSADKLREINESRKRLVEEQLDRILNEYPDALKRIPIVIFADFVYEGIAGILAGKLTETYHVPSIVFAKKNDTVWKGSARSIPNIHLKHHLDTISDTMLGYGGHAGAAGLSVEDAKRDAFIAAAQKAFFDVKPAPADVGFYDVELKEADVPTQYKEQLALEPYGEGCPKPVVCVRGCQLKEKRPGEKAFYMGATKQHVKLSCADFVILGFFLAEEYKEMGEPAVVDVFGHLDENTSQFGTELQLVADAILPAK